MGAFVSLNYHAWPCFVAELLINFVLGYHYQNIIRETGVWQSIYIATSTPSMGRRRFIEWNWHHENGQHEWNIHKRNTCNSTRHSYTDGNSKTYGHANSSPISLTNRLSNKHFWATVEWTSKFLQHFNTLWVVDNLTYTTIQHNFKYQNEHQLFICKPNSLPLILIHSLQYTSF